MIAFNRYSQVNALKNANPNLKTLLAMGGWSAMSGPYSSMASSTSSRSVFINSLIGWLRQYNFDGVDMDWEFPAYASRGGVPADYTNFALLIKVLIYLLLLKNFLSLRTIIPIHL